MLYNPSYLDYYAKRRAAGDVLILDNGAYENTRPVDKDAYFNFIKGLDPQVVVLPDILMSPWRETTSVALRFLDEFAPQLEKAGYRTEWMFVPQTPKSINSNSPLSSRDEFEIGLDKVVNDARVGKYITWIGLGRYLATEFVHMPWKGFRRANLVKTIQQKYYHLKVHALGMANGNLDELKALCDAGVQSIDSSAPVWRGWNARGIEDKEWDKVGIPCDFSAPDHPNTTIIERNLEVIRNVLNS